MVNYKNKSWIYFSLGGMALSLISLFLPIISYTSGRDAGREYDFRVFQLLEGGFADQVQTEYTGKNWIFVSNQAFDTAVAVICMIGVASIVISLLGLRSMSRQYESNWPFRMTVCGLMGTAVPALLLVLAAVLSNDFYLGSISLGAYVYITPVTMAAACAAVARRHKMTRQELRIQREAAQYIRPAGDLVTQR